MSIVSGIYKITLIQNGRFYIGSSANIKGRWKWHKQSQKQLIGKMIKKYGEENFIFEILEQVDPVKELLQLREQHYLDTLQPFPWNDKKGYNLAPHAYTPLGIKRTDETKNKMKEIWHKVRGQTYYKQLSERAKGDNNPAKRPEVKKKISESRMGQGWKDDAVRVAKHVSARTGKKYSEEARINMRLAQQKNNIRSDEAKEKFYLAQRKLYEITKPDKSTFQMYSRELKLFCIDNNLQYANLITTAKTNKPYKGGWIAKLI
jgi:group I intron endonuclease